MRCGSHRKHVVGFVKSVADKRRCFGIGGWRFWLIYSSATTLMVWTKEKGNRQSRDSMVLLERLNSYARYPGMLEIDAGVVCMGTLHIVCLDAILQ